MKKFVTLLLALCALVCIGITLASCDNSEEPNSECSHTYGEWIPEQIETCSLAGRYYSYCTLCSHYETKEVPATGQHTPIYTVFPERIEPTCTSWGRIEASFCETCGITLTEAVNLEPTSHTYDNYKCTACGRFDDGVYPIGLRVDSYDDQYNIVAVLTKNDDGKTYTLKIQGKGETQDFSKMSESNIPWKSYKDVITAVVVENKSEDEVITSLGKYIFNGLSALTAVSLPQSVTELGNSIFEGCTSLESIILPEALTVLPHSAFKECTSLKSVKIPASVEKLGESVFAWCYALEEVDLSLTRISSIPSYAFADCFNLRKIELYSSTSNDDTGVIREICDGAFSGCEKLESISIKDVQIIGECAFERCTLLNTVNLYDIEEIGYKAFKDCTGLESLDFQATSTIRSCAFQGCTNLKYISFSSSGEVACSEDAFYGVSIEEIHIEYIEKWLRSNLHLTLASDTKIYLDEVLLEKLDIPYGITEIKGTFNGYSYLTSVTVSSSVTKIPDYAFAGTAITELVIPDTVEYIGWDYVSGCASLEKLTVPFLGRTADFEEWDNYAKNQFGAGLSSLAELIITGSANGNYRVPHRALYRVDYPIRTLHIGNNVTALGDYCFAGLPLENVYFDNMRIDSIGSGAFDYCDSVESVYVTTATDEGIDKWLSVDFGSTAGTNPLHGGAARLYFNGEVLTVLDLTNRDCTEISEYCFYGYTYLKEIKLSDKITKIGGFAFYNCIGLEKLTVRQNLTSVGMQAFCGCTALEMILYGAFENDDLNIDPIFEDDYKSYAIEQWKKISFEYDSNPLLYADKFFIVTYEGENGSADLVREIEISELQ